jgi:hypothetical protein
MAFDNWNYDLLSFFGFVFKILVLEYLIGCSPK